MKQEIVEEITGQYGNSSNTELLKLSSDLVWIFLGKVFSIFTYCFHNC